MSFAGELSKSRVTGDPVAVRALGARWGLTAELIWSTAESLRTLDAEGAQSDAVEAFLATAGDVERQLRSVHRRYQGAGEALRAYGDALAEAQESAGPALREYDGAVDDRDAARRLAEKYEGMALVAGSEEARADYEQLARVQRTRHEEASARVARHGARVDAAHAAVEAAAATAVASLDDLEADGPCDSVWDDLSGAAAAAFDGFQQWMEDNDSWISVVLDVAGVVGSILAGLALIIPGVNVVAAIIMVSVFALTAARALAGTGTWLAVGVAAFSLVTFGTGAVLVTGAKAATGGVAANRVAGLVTTGAPRSLAQSWVQSSWQRAAPSFGNSRLAWSVGDVTTAQIRHFLRPGAPGAQFDDAVQVARIARDLGISRALNVVDLGQSIGRSAWGAGSSILESRDGVSGAGS